MNGERRNDIGNKVLIGLISTLVVIIMGFSINVAGKANEKANTNKVNIKGMEVRAEVEHRFTRDSIQEIKMDIREIKKAVVK